MGKYANDVKDLLTYVGEKDNISAVIHCMTRMRFVLADPAVVPERELKKYLSPQ